MLERRIKEFPLGGISGITKVLIQQEEKTFYLNQATGGFLR